jgi:predicted MPP superfamily phosphohydrolase
MMKKFTKLLKIITLLFLPLTIFAQNQKSNLAQALQELNQKRGVFFTYDEQKIGKKSVNTIKDFTGNIEDILGNILQNTGLIFKKIGDNTYTILTEEASSKAKKISQEAIISPPKINKFTISGYVREQNSGELLRDVTVSLPDLNIGTTTNNYGFYSISIPPHEKLKIRYSFVGY